MSKPFKVLALGGSETTNALPLSWSADAHRIWMEELRCRYRTPGSWPALLMAHLDAAARGLAAPDDRALSRHRSALQRPGKTSDWEHGRLWNVAIAGATLTCLEALLAALLRRVQAFDPDLVVTCVGSHDFRGEDLSLQGSDLLEAGESHLFEPQMHYKFEALREVEAFRATLTRFARVLRKCCPNARGVVLGLDLDPRTIGDQGERLAGFRNAAQAAAERVGHLYLPPLSISERSTAENEGWFLPDGFPAEKHHAATAAAIARAIRPGSLAPQRPGGETVPTRNHSATATRERSLPRVRLEEPSQGIDPFRVLIIGASESNRRRSAKASRDAHAEWTAMLRKRYEIQGMWPARFMWLIEQRFARESRETAPLSAQPWSQDYLFSRGRIYAWRSVELWNLASPRASVSLAKTVAHTLGDQLAAFAPDLIAICLGRTDLIERKGVMAGIDFLELGRVPRVHPHRVYEYQPQAKPERFEATLDELADILSHHCPDATQAYLGMLPMPALSRLQAERHAQFDRAIRRIAEARGALFVGYRCLNGEQGKELGRWLHPDHHPNDRFNQAIAEELSARAEALVRLRIVSTVRTGCSGSPSTSS